MHYKAQQRPKLVHRQSLHRGRLSEDSAVRKKKKHFDNIFTVTKHVVGEGGGERGVSGQSVTYIWAPPVSPWQGWCGLKHTGRGVGVVGWEGMRRHTRAFVVHSVQWSVGSGSGWGVRAWGS